MLPPPLVRAFCAIVIGCRSTTRVASLRYSAGEGGASLYRPLRGERIVERPVLHVALPALHDRAAHAGVPGLRGSRAVSAFGKCRCASGIRSSRRMRLKHSSRSARSKLSGCVTGTSRPVVDSNHSSMPQKCAVPHVEAELVDDARDERQLLGRPDRAADADRIVVGALPPRVDVLQRLGEIELLERVVEDDREAGPREREQIARRQAARPRR